MTRLHTLRFAAALTLVLLAGFGCGSKISEANYYKVQYGMSEDSVEDLLGPAHAESTEPAQSRDRKVKTWTRDRLTLRVVFEDGKVVKRSAEGIPSESAGAQQRRR